MQDGLVPICKLYTPVLGCNSSDWHSQTMMHTSLQVPKACIAARTRCSLRHCRHQFACVSSTVHVKWHSAYVLHGVHLLLLMKPNHLCGSGPLQRTIHCQHCYQFLMPASRQPVCLLGSPCQAESCPSWLHGIAQVQIACCHTPFLYGHPWKASNYAFSTSSEVHRASACLTLQYSA